MRSSEHQEQKAVIELCEWYSKKDPRYGLLFAIPNGGHRHIAVASKLKAEGVRKGVPDLMLPVANPPYHGLFIEMKVKPNKASKEQLEWISKLTEQGYKASVCYSWTEAIETIKHYLDRTSD